jgi:hypothetical protein
MGRLSALCSRARLVGLCRNLLISRQFNNLEFWLPKSKSPMWCGHLGLGGYACTRIPAVSLALFQGSINVAAGVRGGWRSDLDVQGSSVGTCRCGRRLRWLAKKHLTIEGFFPGPTRGAPTPTNRFEVRGNPPYLTSWTVFAWPTPGQIWHNNLDNRIAHFRLQ